MRKCCTHYSDYFLEIETNCLPNSELLMRVDPKKIVRFKIPTQPVLDPTDFWGPFNIREKKFLPTGPIGVSINGVPFFSKEKNNNSLYPRINYFYDQLPTNINFYSQQSQFSNINDMIEYQLENNQHSPIIGFSFDGFPIYGPLGWDSNKKVKIMSSSYQNNEYVDNLGDLDICNGILSPTPEYPNGIYHYHTTIKTKNGHPELSEKGEIISIYPHIIARYRGIPEVRNFI